VVASTDVKWSIREFAIAGVFSFRLRHPHVRRPMNRVASRAKLENGQVGVPEREAERVEQQVSGDMIWRVMQEYADSLANMVD